MRRRRGFVLAATIAAFASVAAAAGTDRSGPARLIYESERHLLTADFTAASAILDGALAGTSEPKERLMLFLQGLRVQQSARISGRPFPEENEERTIAEVERLAASLEDGELRGLARLATATSRYFRILSTGKLEPAAGLVSEFEQSAREIKAPCLRARAKFFAALIPQVLGKVRESEPGLREARTLALEGKCREELAFVDRHLAAVAEEGGDITAARSLNARSVALRRELGTNVYLSYALIYQAELDAKAGDVTGAKANLREALEIAVTRDLPAQKRSACAAAARLDLDFPSC